jgi:uncharacterized phage protein (predicted DNA packaging)
MALLDDVKDALRVSDTSKDTEISDLIAAAQADLMIAGINSSLINILSPDPLIKRAIVLFAKAQYGWDNQEADRFQKCYDLLKASLTLSADYTNYTPIPPSSIDNAFVEDVAADWGIE